MKLLGILLTIIAAYLAVNNLIHTNNIPTTNPETQVTYDQVYPVFARNCAGCHNAHTEGRNWLIESDVIQKRTIMYNRVFIKGDMPMFFRLFSGEDRRLLRKYLEQPLIWNK